jgi:hypothetical protein
MPYADPAKGMRSTTLADAKKSGGKLLPSVTTIAGKWKGEALINYLQRQMHVATRTTPFVAGQSDDDYYAECEKWADEHSSLARDWGSGFHAIAEAYSLGQVPTVTSQYEASYAKFIEWHAAEVNSIIWAEKILVNLEQGYAGKSDVLYEDMDGRRVLLDYKTQSTKKGRCNFWPNFSVQLAAYAYCDDMEVDAIQSMVISSTEPGLIEVKEYTDKTILEYYRLFQGLCEFWFYDSNYDPRQADLTVSEKITKAGL